MRVLLATGNSGGPATYTEILTHLLPKHGIDVHVVSFAEVVYLPPGIRHLVFLSRLLRHARGVDIIYAQDPISTGIPALLASFLLWKRLFLRVGGDYAWEQGTIRFGVATGLNHFYKDTSKYRLPVRIFIFLQYAVATLVEKVIVPSKYLKGIVHEWGIENEKIVVIYTSVSNIKRADNRATLRGLIQFDGKLVVSVGRLVPWKGFDVLIRTIPNLLTVFPNLKLMIIGTGPDYNRLDALLTTLSLGEHVILAGALPREITLRYIEAADVTVLNTTYEGFSHTLLETMTIGVPIVTTYAGGNKELLRKDKDALVVPHGRNKDLEKAITTILSKPAIARSLVKNAGERSKIFSNEKMIQQLLQVFSA